MSDCDGGQAVGGWERGDCLTICTQTSCRRYQQKEGEEGKGKGKRKEGRKGPWPWPNRRRFSTN